MKKTFLNWTLTSSEDKRVISATVPGAVQLDYAREDNYAPYYYGLNFKAFDHMEDCTIFYRTVLDFTCEKDEKATLCFEGIDYDFEILANSKVLYKGEGMFTPIKLDVTSFSGKKTELTVKINPIPKRFAEPRNRSQAAWCCKPASSYGWDWHPRLVPSGIWGEAYLWISELGNPASLEASYRLSDDLTLVTVSGVTTAYGDAELSVELISPEGKTVASTDVTVPEGSEKEFSLTLKNPELWFPRGYGSQPLYRLKVSGKSDTIERRIGFRRSKLVLNEGSEIFESAFPKGPKAAPMTIEINGKRVFAKGSNWVNTEIFPCMMTNDRYDELLELAYDANMNILRMWGGQFINHEHFYEKCDELGIMIWQEFMLSCNLHPDNDNYLAVLKQEATTIIKRLRTHPCLAFWCGGNELFNSWSGLTVQSHPLRLLDSLCYEHDRFTPFNMTSPLHGVSHGSYVKVQFPDAERKAGIYDNGEEFICALKRSRSTAYTEFGCNGASPKEYILKYIMDEKNFEDCNAENPIWVDHHAFKAWNESSWLGVPEIIFFFGGYDSSTDLVEKSIYLQDLCYKSMFEEMRRQAPLCSMAVNWDFNEPWPCAAGNSLVNWPAEPKSCLKSVKEALRSTLVSLEVPHNRYLTDEVFKGNIWILNDCDEQVPELKTDVYLVSGDKRTLLASVCTPSVGARKNAKGEGFSFKVDESLPERFSVELECEGHPEYSSVYNFVHNKKLSLADVKTTVSTAANDDFSDFLK